MNFSRIVWKKGKDNRLHSPFVHLKCKFEIYLWEKASPPSPFRPRDYSTSNCAIFRACNFSIPCDYLLLHDVAELLKMSSMYYNVLFKLITAVKHLKLFEWLHFQSYSGQKQWTTHLDNSVLIRWALAGKKFTADRRKVQMSEISRHHPIIRPSAQVKHKRGQGNIWNNFLVPKRRFRFLELVHVFL